MQYSSAACGRWPSFSPYEHTEQADCQGENEIEKKKPNKQKNRTIASVTSVAATTVLILTVLLRAEQLIGPPSFVVNDVEPAEHWPP